jgi:hypothetical protein
MHSIRVSKLFWLQRQVVAVRFQWRQMTMNLVDGTRLRRRAYDLDRGIKRDC